MSLIGCGNANFRDEMLDRDGYQLSACFDQGLALTTVQGYWVKVFSIKPDLRHLPVVERPDE